jgi:hypothetical protein
VYVTHPDYDHVRSLLEILKPASPDVVIYYATRAAPEEAARLGKLVGETRPHHTSVVFGAKAAAASVLGHSRSQGRFLPVRSIPVFSSRRRGQWRRDSVARGPLCASRSESGLCESRRRDRPA